MNLFTVVSKSFVRRLAAVIVLSALAAALISGVFLYVYADRGLGETYAERVSAISAYKKEVIKDSLYIYLAFAVCAAVAVVVFSIYYSHRVTGPLYRIRKFSDDMAEGRFGAEYKFRSGDFIHPLAETASAFSEKYGRTYDSVKGAAEELERAAAELKKCIEEGDRKRAEELRAVISEEAEKLAKTLMEVRV